MDRNCQIINLTKSPLNFLTKDGEHIVIESSQEVRVTIQREENSKVTGFFKERPIKVNRTKLGKVEGLPPKKDGVILIVPSFVYYQVFLERDDVYIVDEPVKDNKTIKIGRAISRPSYSYISNKMREISNLVSSIKSSDEDTVNKLFKLKHIVDSINTE